MERFLTDEIKNRFSHITLENTYPYEMIVGDRIKRYISSTNKMRHAKILEEWMIDGLLPYDQKAFEFIQDNAFYYAANRIAELGYMITHISNDKGVEFNIFYCSKMLNEYQKLRLRLWYEFLSNAGKDFNICVSHNEEIKEYKNNQVTDYLAKQDVLNDSYIHQLVMKYPNYE